VCHKRRGRAKYPDKGWGNVNPSQKMGAYTGPVAWPEKSGYEITQDASEVEYE
jgi:hypothetical protein